jgi:hypothetical protein
MMARDLHSVSAWGWVGALCIALSVAVAQDAMRPVTVELTVPDATWSIRISEVYRVTNELWVVSALTRSAGVGIAAISTVRDTVELAASPLPVRHFVLGKTWKWANPEKSMTFLTSRAEIGDRLMSAERLYVAKPGSGQASATAKQGATP